MKQSFMTRAKAIMAKVKQGYFQSQEISDPAANANLGGVIARPAYVAASLNSTKVLNVNIKWPQRNDLYEDINYAYTGVVPQTNVGPQYQVVQGAGYDGIQPWETQPELPIRRPWE